jgi:hypothetical protein
MMPTMSTVGRHASSAAACLYHLFLYGFLELGIGVLGGVPLARATDPMVGIRSLAMGDSLRGLATGAEGMLLNPSGIAAQKQFSATGFYEFRVQTLGSFLHASVSDSVTQQYISLGLYYNFVHETPHFSYLLAEGGNSTRVFNITSNDILRSGNEVGLVAAIPLGDRLAIGGTFKYGDYSLTSQLHPNDVPPDFTYANPIISGDHGVDLGSIGSVVSFDVGATLRIIDELRLGVAGQNLWAHGFEMPTRLGFGLAYRFNQTLLFAADGMIDFNGSQECTAVSTLGLCSQSQPRLTYRIGGGGEYYIANHVPIRLGYMYDSNLGASHVSGGLGYFGSGFGVDFSLRQRVSAGNETILLLGLRYQK